MDLLQQASSLLSSYNHTYLPIDSKSLQMWRTTQPVGGTGTAQVSQDRDCHALHFPGSVWAFCGFVGLEYHPPFPSLLSEILPTISQSSSGPSVKPPLTTLTGSGVLCLGFTMESSGML